MPENYKDHLFALIFCGGGGTRLWPYSREKRPKQFLTLGGTKTLIRKTLDRVLPIIPKDRIYIITLPDYTDEVRQEIPEIPSRQVIAEPARRDTLLAAGYGAVVIKKKDPQAIICNLWSDQVITGVEEYREALLAGAQTAWKEDALVTTGVKAKYAHPGLEYVRKGDLYDTVDDTRVHKVDDFIERPERSGKDPNKLFEDKKVLWHVGLWIWKAETFLNAVNKYSPQTGNTLDAISKCLGKFWLRNKIVAEYQKSPKVQIDMVISKEEKTMFVVEGRYEWLDVGDFNVFWMMKDKDENNNVAILSGGSEWVDIDSKDSFVLSDGKKQVATFGLKDSIVVVMDDIVLVGDRNQSQKVKQIVNELKDKKKKEYL